MTREHVERLIDRAARAAEQERETGSLAAQVVAADVAADVDHRARLTVRQVLDSLAVAVLLPPMQGDE